MPTVQDMQTSLEDARFFYEKHLEPIIRGSEEQQDPELIRKYFRAYLHCWKSILYFVQEIKVLSGKAWGKWCDEWKQHVLDDSEQKIFDYLRETRNHDTHQGTIVITKQVAILTPIVMFRPPVVKLGEPPEIELISCCERGLIVAEKLIREHPNV